MILPRIILSLLKTRLRVLRLEAGLTLTQVAGELGVTKEHIWQFEHGRVVEPSVELLRRYLHACGRRWSDVADIMDNVPVPRLDTTPIDKSRLPARVRTALKRKLNRTAERYAGSQAYPERGRPRRPEDQRIATERLTRYRQVAELIELGVARFLKARQVPHCDHSKYKAAARQMLGLLWRGRAADSAATRDRSAQLVSKGLDPKLARRVRQVVRREFSRLKLRHAKLFASGL